MKWSTYKSLSPIGAAIGDLSPITVHLLEVSQAAGDCLDMAFVELWKQVLSEQIENADLEWEILLFECWTDAALVNAVFTTPNRSYSAKSECRLVADELDDEYESILESATDLKHLNDTLNAILQKYFELLQHASTVAPIPSLIALIRRQRSMSVWATLCHFKDQMVRLDV